MNKPFAKRFVATMICVPAVLILTGCATATPYQPAGKSRFGYSQEQLEYLRYRVAFTGNGHTDPETVQNYLLYRSARITLETGNDYFIITHQGTDYGGASNASGRIGTGGAVGSGGFTIGIGTLLGRGSGTHRAYATILLGKGTKPADQPRAYNAHEIERRLRPRIKRRANPEKTGS